MIGSSQLSNFETTARSILARLPEWQKLLSHFDLADEGFAFIPLFVPDANWANVCKEVLAQFLVSLTRKKILEVPINQPDDLKQLAGTLFELQPGDDIGAVWVAAPIIQNDNNYELWLPAWREGMARLNQYRNPFREKFNVPVLLVGTDWTQSIISNMAPDLWSVRTIMVRIEPSAELAKLQQATLETVSPENPSTEGLNVDPEYALREAASLRGQQGKEASLSRLLSRAASGFIARAQYRKALEISQEVVELNRKLLRDLEERKTSPDTEEFTSVYRDAEIALASSLANKGEVLRNLGKLAEAIEILDEAILIYKKLVAGNEDIDLANSLSLALLNKGIAFYYSGMLTKAIESYDEAISRYKNLIELKATALTNNLALALMNKGEALRGLGKLPEAVSSFDESISTFKRLIETEGSVEASFNLPVALMNKGSALFNMGKLQEAIENYDESISIIKKSIAEGRIDITNWLSMALMNKGEALRNLGQVNEAIEILDESISLYKQMIEDENRNELTGDLALVFLNKSNALQNLYLFDDAIDSLNEAIAIYRQLVVNENRTELSNYLALALMNKGTAFNTLGRYSEAIKTLDEAISTLKELIEIKGRTELSGYVAMAIMNKGSALLGLDEFSQAIEKYDEAISSYKALIETQGQTDFTNNLAMTFTNKGVALRRIGRLQEAIYSFDESIARYERLVEVESRVEFSNDLAMAYNNKAAALIDEKKFEGALDCYNKSISLRETAISQLGMIHLLPLLIQTVRYRISILIELASWKEIADDVRRVFTALLPFEEIQLSDSIKQTTIQELGGLLYSLKQLPPENLNSIYEILGDDSGVLREYVEALPDETRDGNLDAQN